MGYSTPQPMRMRAILVTAAAALAIALCESAVFAHAKLLRTQPENNATLQQPPQDVELWFNEELQPKFNTITVTDQNGKRVDKNNVSLAEGNKKLQIDLENLGSGTYTVVWKVLSADQHAMKGQFIFKVSIASAAGATPTQSTAQATSPQTPPTEPAQESTATVGLSIVRWLQYLASMTLFGGFLFQLLILKPALRQAGLLDEYQRSKSGFSKLSWLSLVLLTLALIASLIAETAMVHDVSFAQALAPSRIYQVLVSTGFGGPWMLQLVMLVIVAVSLWLFGKGSQSWLLWVGVIALAVMFFALSSTGHAGAAAKEWRSALISDWIHLLTAGLWVGGLFHLTLNFPRVISTVAPLKKMKLLSQVIRLFTWYAIPCTILLALTGVYNSWIHLDSFGELWSTTYGDTVLLKIAIFIPMLVLGGVNTFILHPRAKRLAEPAGQTAQSDSLKVDRGFRRSVAIEGALGVVVLLAAAILVFLQPAREHPGMTESERPTSTITHNLR